MHLLTNVHLVRNSKVSRVVWDWGFLAVNGNILHLVICHVMYCSRQVPTLCKKSTASYHEDDFFISLVPVYWSHIPVDHNINQVVQKNYSWGRIVSQLNELRIFIVWTPWRFALFCVDDVSSVRNIICACSVSLCPVRGLIRLISRLFLWF
jgi:hypothetical protein